MSLPEPPVVGTILRSTESFDANTEEDAGGGLDDYRRERMTASGSFHIE